MDYNITEEQKLFSHFKQRINELRNDYCDFTIFVEDTYFKVHKYILISWSDYFKALFRHESLESNNNEIRFEDISRDALEKILDFCYQFKLELDEENVQDVLFASCKLQIRSCQELCVNYISSRVDNSNCFGVLAVADRCDLNELYETTLEYCLDNFLNLIETDEYPLLDANHLKKLISNDRLNVENEIDIVKAIFKWSHTNVIEEKLDEILSQVRFSLMKPKELIDLSKNKQIASLKNCSSLINEAKDFHLLHDNYHGEDELKLMMHKPRSTLRLRQRIYAIGGWSTKDHSTARVEKYDPYMDEWTEVQSMNTPRCALGVAVLGNFIYAIGGHDGFVNLKTVERYNLKTGKWTDDVANISIERCSLSAVALNGFIYSIGGQKNTNNADKSIQSLQIVEKYDPSINKWTECEPLRVERLGGGVATLGGYIYVIGGSASGDTLDTVERYDPELNQWSSVASMRISRKHFGCTSLNDRIYVYGGKYCKGGQEIELAFGEVFEPQTNSWNYITEMPTKRSGLSLVELDELIYAVGGNDLKLVEVYDPNQKSWQTKHEMISPRLGGGLVVDSKLTN